VKKIKAVSGRGKNLLMVLLIILPLGAAVFSLFIGKYHISPEEFARAIAAFIKSGINTNNAETVIFKVRFPRIIAAALAGGSLAAAGLAFQIVFRNPLASPDVLGASAGAGLGACIAIIAGASPLMIQGTAFFSGLAAVGLTCLISGRLGRGEAALYILTGMVISAVFHAGIGLVKYTADPYSQLQTITFWLMGSMTLIELSQLPILAIGTIIGMIPLIIYRWKLNLLSFDDNESSSMGLDTVPFRLLIIAASTLLCSVATATCGMVGWVGLMVPHLARSLTGANTRLLLPASFLIGSTFLIFIDDITRIILSIELPLGVLTAIIGAPVFIVLLVKGQGKWK
jgi:iron complex transport system permease protein